MKEIHTDKSDTFLVVVQDDTNTVLLGAGTIPFSKPTEFHGKELYNLFPEVYHQKLHQFMYRLQRNRIQLDRLFHIEVDGVLKTVYLSGISRRGKTLILGGLHALDFPGHLKNYLNASALEADMYGFIPKEILSLLRERDISDSATENTVYSVEDELPFLTSWDYFNITLTSMDDAVISTDRLGRVVYMNPIAEGITSYTQKEIKGKNLGELFEIKCNMFDNLHEALDTCLVTGKRFSLDTNSTLINKNGWEIPIQGTLAPIQDKKNLMYGMILVFRDITQNVLTELSLRKTQETLQKIMQTTPDLITVYDYEQKQTVFANHEFYKRLFPQVPVDSPISRDMLYQVVFEDDYQIIQNTHIKVLDLKPGENAEFEFRVYYPDGDLRWLSSRFSCFQKGPDNIVQQVLMAAADITDRKMVETQIMKLAVRDGLTGLFNHRELYLVLNEEIERTLRYDSEFSLIMGDLDHFKDFNDKYGHLAGDEVLRNVAQIIRSQVRSLDKVFRYGGEEFMMLIPGTDTDGSVQLAERLRDAIEKSKVQLPNGTHLSVTMSFGVANVRDIMVRTPNAMVNAVDKALYLSKNTGRNKVTLYMQKSNL